MAYRQPITSDPYPDYPIDGYDRDEVDYLGTAAGSPYYFAPTKDTIFATSVDEEEGRLSPNPDTETVVEDLESDLGEFLEDVGEELGWDGLAEWAHDHLEEG